jgi:hypothetical protein
VPDQHGDDRRGDAGGDGQQAAGLGEGMEQLRVGSAALIRGFERLLEASICARHRATMDGEEPWEEMVRAEFLMEPVSRRWA